ncbi:amino acid adenylation domain-containing protein [Nocardia sp. NPDC127579]|uniref:amino acid adenylation domain-containing protein n=1 Tax=Nocardia sp. NPDC127579 TaxID=3345402 RepID=UPI00362DDFDD
MSRPTRTRPARPQRSRVKHLPQLLAATVETNPSGIAVVFADAEATRARLTYAELDERSTRLARLLIDHGVGPDDLVAVSVPRSVESVLAVWAVAKAGAGFVPVDPNHPADRIAYMVSDSGAVLGLTVGSSADVVAPGIQWLVIDDPGVQAELRQYPSEPVTYADRPRMLRAEHPAYVGYTSGATGVSEGVVVTQAGLSSLCYEQRDRFRVTSDSRTLHLSAPSDESSLLELLLAVGGAATMVVVASTVRGGGELAELLKRERVTHAFATPAALASVDPTGLDELRVVGAGGAVCPPELVRRWGPGREFFSVYGPMEASGCANISPPLAPGDPLTIGGPIRAITEYVLDDRLCPVPDGVLGELYIAGVQMARGYHKRPGSTAARFVANPFDPNGSRLFRTGDLVSRSSAGHLDYLGRIDFQVPTSSTVLDDISLTPARNSELLGRDDFQVPATSAVLDEVSLTPPGNPDRVSVPESRAAGVRMQRTDAGEPAARPENLEGFGPRPVLTPMPRPARIPLSPAQQRYWFRNQYDPAASAVDNIPIAVRVSGALDVAALGAAIGDVFARHEALRTVYPAAPEGPFQVVHPAPAKPFALRPIDVHPDHIVARIVELAVTTFDVAVDVPVAIALFRLAPAEHVIGFVVHQVAADGSSTAPLARDVRIAYTARTGGTRPQWLPLPVQYADYALWQWAVLGSEADPGSVASRQIGYWKRTLAGLPDQLELPTDRPRPPSRSLRGDTVRFRISAQRHARLQEIARAADASLFMVCHAALAVLLARLSDTADIAVGTQVTGRGEPELDDLIGMFANTLVLRTRVRPELGFTELLAEVRERNLEAHAHADIPFERLLEVLAPARGPLFQVGLTLQNSLRTRFELPGMTVSGVDFDTWSAKSDLHLTLADSYAEDGAPAEMNAEFVYATDIFDGPTVLGFAERFVRVLDAVIADPAVQVGAIDPVMAATDNDRVLDAVIADPAAAVGAIEPVPAAADNDRVLETWSATAHPLDPAATLAGLLDATVAANPDGVALVADAPTGRIELTYAELDVRVNRLARHLISLGVGPESRVVLALRRSVDLVVAMYAVTRSGGAYVPLDPEQPVDHLNRLLDAAAPVCVLTNVETGFGTGPFPIVQIDDIRAGDTAPVTDADRSAPLRPDNTAYVLVTPGSSGVAVTHRAIANQLRWKAEEFGLTPKDGMLLETAATLNLSVWEFWSAAVCGGRLVIATADGHQDPAYLGELITREWVTTLHTVPSMLGALVSAGLPECMWRVLTLGEPLPGALAQRLRRERPLVELFNLYGRTEAAVSITSHKVTTADETSVPIGRPEPNSQVFVLDGHLNSVPVGASGELYLAGAQLARGYLGRPALTADRFVANPFGPSGTRMYRTGDLAAWNADGELEYRGRTETRVEQHTDAATDVRVAPSTWPQRIPLSPAQRRMWFFNRFDPESAAYNVPIAVRLTGSLDVAALRHAIADVVDRHETLRTVYPGTEAGPVQVILAAEQVELGLSAVAADDVEKAVVEVFSTGFDVTAAPPVRAALFDIAGRGADYVLAVAVHHISADGWSAAPFTRDLMTAYQARSAGMAPGWAPLAVQYSDYVTRQRELLGSAADPESVTARQIAFWRATLADLPDHLDLPADRPRPPVRSCAGEQVEVVIDADLHRALVDLSEQQGAPLFTTVQTALAVLLARLSGSADIAIGTLRPGRDEAAVADLIGVFVNTLVVRTKVDMGAGFADLVARQRVLDTQVFANADVPFEQLLEVLNPVRSTARHPLFQVGLTVRNISRTTLDLPGLTVAPFDPDTRLSQFDLHWELIDSYDADGAPAGLGGFLTYATDLFDASTATGFANRFTGLLRDLVATPHAPVGDLELLDTAERSVLTTRNTTAHHVDSSATLASLLAATVAADPSATALVTDDGAQLTYAELDARVNRLARHLIHLGVAPESRVALAIRHSVDLVVAMYAVTVAGGAYVPLDPDQPAARSAYLLEATAPVCVLSTSREAFTAGSVPVIEIDAPADRTPSGGPEDVAAPAGYSSAPVTDADRVAPLRPGNTAYVIFTSGSTGRPKGVAVTHTAIVNQLLWKTREFGLDAADAVLSKTAPTFDLSVWEFWSAAVCGGRLVIASVAGREDPAYLNELIAREWVTTLHVVPSLLDALVTAGLPDSLWRILAIGAALPASLARQVRTVAPRVELFNLYGPTEAAVSATAHRVTGGDELSVPIGVPQWNCRVHVLDARLRAVPTGVTGELYLAGAQLARGYEGCAGLSAERFVADPFERGARMYRTGDLVAWNRKGELEYRGRADLQLQVRGMRIEPEEIESALLAVREVAQAAVVVKSDRLVAYLVPRPAMTSAVPEEHPADVLGATVQAARLATLRTGAVVDIARVQSALADTLPSHMVPSEFVVLDAVPLTGNGKVDRKALPETDFELRAARAAVTPLEITVTDLFAEVLGVSRIGVDEDFFELGGDSLLAIELTTRLSHTLARPVPVLWMFTDPTPAGILTNLDLRNPRA